MVHKDLEKLLPYYTLWVKVMLVSQLPSFQTQQNRGGQAFLQHFYIFLLLKNYVTHGEFLLFNKRFPVVPFLLLL